MIRNKRSSLFDCFKKKHKIALDLYEREYIAKRRWRKIWLLRNILLASDEFSLLIPRKKHHHYGMSLGEEFSIERENLLETLNKDWIIYPWNTWKRYWDIFIGVIKMYYCFAIPYYLCFNYLLTIELISWDSVLDFIMFIDILFQLSSAYISEKMLVDERIKIIQNRFKNGLTIDLICFFPWYIFYEELLWLRILRLLQVKALRQALDKTVFI